ncbi:hypothetical protein E4634_02410 [Mangrovimicrobium sediminis]|uniref:Tetratricopeptide repeat protein n=1 Tax=Mangrovimicrobium sediminis TaxID=2562682 RepID=A0A4Z0M8P5_9GAMM|nr:hypothetical protein [Haliea sp. SAOS-164]TGD75748.1 hypothetical protein E4634_02410 [Haliea sp. SAOS-164]
MKSPQAQPLEPTPFELAPPSPAAEPPPPAGAPRWLWPALGALLLAALLVVFWLPQRVTPPEAEPGTVATPSPAHTPAQGGSSQAVEEDSPWADAQTAKLRREAREVLEQLLAVQFELDEHGAEQWAGEAYSSAIAAARQGDEDYRENRFVAAREAYASALQQLEAIRADLPAAGERQLAAVGEAIDSNALDAARSALDIARLIDPDAGAIPALEQRLQQLPRVNELQEGAAAAEASGDLAAAEAALAEAAQLDPAHPRVQAQLQRVTAAYRDLQFNQAMSEGYRALDSADYSAARAAFQRAAGLREGSDEATSALAELAVAEQSGRLGRLKSRGAQQEQDEHWSDAVTAYEQALALDASVVFAREGLARAQRRAALDKGLQDIVDNPGRLSDVAVAEAAGKLLAQGRGIDNPGPRLRGQVETIDTLLRKANTPVTVTLHSDGQTEVLIYRTARLGRFQQRQLDLRPGSYTVRGSRVGYRDVLVTLEVSADQAPAPVTVACSERIL